MIKPDMPMVLLHPGVNQNCLPNADLTALMEDAVYSQSLQYKVIPNQLKKAGNFLWRH
jgi:hypothetical protein